MRKEKKIPGQRYGAATFAPWSKPWIRTRIIHQSRILLLVLSVKAIYVRDHPTDGSRAVEIYKQWWSCLEEVVAIPKENWWQMQKENSIFRSALPTFTYRRHHHPPIFQLYWRVFRQSLLNCKVMQVKTAIIITTTVTALPENNTMLSL